MRWVPSITDSATTEWKLNLCSFKVLKNKLQSPEIWKSCKKNKKIFWHTTCLWSPCECVHRQPSTYACTACCIPVSSVLFCNLFVFLQLCDTYPRYLYVPAHASASILLGSSRFRSKGRLPVLTYLHHNKVYPVSSFRIDWFSDAKVPRNQDVCSVDLKSLRRRQSRWTVHTGSETRIWLQNQCFYRPCQNSRD